MNIPHPSPQQAADVIAVNPPRTLGRPTGFAGKIHDLSVLRDSPLSS
jgi:hypothetical protein